MIQVFPLSITSLYVAFVIKCYLVRHWIKTKFTFTYQHYQSQLPVTYFIIKKSLTWSQLNDYLQDIRQRSELANIIIIGSDIDYEGLFKKHYRILGIIDTSNTKSLTFIRRQVHGYLERIYEVASDKNC